MGEGGDGGGWKGEMGEGGKGEMGEGGKGKMGDSSLTWGPGTAKLAKTCRLKVALIRHAGSRLRSLDMQAQGCAHYIHAGSRLRSLEYITHTTPHHLHPPLPIYTHCSPLTHLCRALPPAA